RARHTMARRRAPASVHPRSHRLEESVPKHTLVLSAIALACIAAIDAHAQQQAPAPAEAAASAPRATTTLETVVVTSQKRREDVQKVPLSVSVLGGDAIKENHVTDLTDLT